MAAEKHANGRTYYGIYVGKHPKTGTSVKQYLGLGPIAAALELRAAQLSAARRRQINDELSERERISGAGQATLKAINSVKQVLVSAMAALGYTQHARGEWRQRRLMTRVHVADDLNAVVHTPRSPADNPFPASVHKSLELMAGEAGARINTAISAWLELLGTVDPVALEKLKFGIKSKFDDLLRPGDSDLERACVGRVLICALQVQVIALCAKTRESMSKSHLKFLRERQVSARRRLATAERTLAFIRTVLQQGREFTASQVKQN